MERLPTQIGVTVQDPVTHTHVRQSDGSEGFISFGPYVSIERGSYIAGFYIKKIGHSNDNAVVLDVVAGSGTTEVAKKRHLASKLFDDLSAFVFLPFTASENLENVEVRLFVEGGVTVEVHGLTIFSSDELCWKAA